MDRIQARNLSGHSEDLRVLPRVTDQIRLGERVELNPDLKAIDPAPGKAFPILGHGDAVKLPTIDAHDLPLPLQIGDRGRVKDDGLIAARTLCDPRLAIVVQAPGVDSAVLVNGKGMRVTCCDVGHCFGEAEFAGDEAVELAALDDAAAELVLLAGAPGEDGAGTGEGEGVVGACSDFGDFLEVGEEDREALDLGGW